MKPNYFFLILICLFSLLSCNNKIEEPTFSEFAISDTANVTTIVYDEDSIRLIKEENPIVFEIKGLEISYYAKLNGELTSNFNYGDSIEVGWTIKNIMPTIDTVIIGYESVGTCWDNNQYVYPNMSTIQKKEPSEKRICILKEQESYSYSCKYDTKLLDRDTKDYYYEPIGYDFHGKIDTKFIGNSIATNDPWQYICLWEIQPKYRYIMADDKSYLYSYDTRYIIAPRIKLFFHIL